MIVLHVENNEVTRSQLERTLKVVDHQLAGYAYQATGMVEAAKKMIHAGEVRVLVLDLGLDNQWANQHHLSSELANALKDPNWTAPKGFAAYELALEARQRRVPAVAVLTNYADQLGPPAQEVLDGLKKIFHADAAFTKDECGLQQCVNWVRGKIGLVS